jgi:hypothetical protein
MSRWRRTWQRQTRHRHTDTDTQTHRHTPRSRRTSQVAVSPYSLARCSGVRPPLLMPALNISTKIIIIGNILVIQGNSRFL